MFPDSQDHLGEVQHQRHQGVGQEQGLPQGVNFWKNCIYKGCSGWLWWPFQGDPCFPRMHHLWACGNFRNACKASDAQCCKFNELEDRTKGSENPGSKSFLRILIGIGTPLRIGGKDRDISLEKANPDPIHVYVLRQGILGTVGLIWNLSSMYIGLLTMDFH